MSCSILVRNGENINETWKSYAIRYRILYWSNNYFLNKTHNFKSKQVFLVLTEVETEQSSHAIEIAQLMFNFLNAKFDIEKNYIYSLNTNNVPACKEQNLRKLIVEKLKYINILVIQYIKEILQLSIQTGYMILIYLYQMNLKEKYKDFKKIHQY